MHSCLNTPRSTNQINSWTSTQDSRLSFMRTLKAHPVWIFLQSIIPPHVEHFDHPDLTVSNFTENSIGIERVNTLIKTSKRDQFMVIPHPQEQTQ